MTNLNTQPGAAPATGNTARDQEMYAAGIRTGEENAKHNAAIRAGAAPGVSTVEDKPAAYLTLDEDGSPCMLFFDVVEARAFCEIGEEPEALWRRPAPAAGDALDAVTEALRILRAARGSIRNHQVSGPTSLSTDSRALVNADDDILQAVKVLRGSLDAAQRKGGA
ncbi:hypothetical protein [Achromobacter xylosoxidans]|uniref:hypothetical protein n=1 Tax=Alcaligenes xylosoxydans xylosoxydans TaxID=85698 RepID=UPI001F135A21|nr:hypothetical protein [Achromobacter xylosoxidans]